ncbi:MAG: hypothetical protein C0619_05400 [Desulfuromonas sp.]|nr:MAG: hypothetical protein C0619_05400 [Desulfuromonas sp.]
MDVVQKNCVGFAIFHIVIFVGFLVFMKSQAGVAQHQLNWIFWWLIDFPVSLLVFLAKPVGFKSVWTLYIIHGVIGTIWWYFLPRILLAIDPRSRR